MDAARILIVEDEQITAADIGDILEGLGHKVVGVVANAAAAVNHAERSRPDLVLMDIQLRGAADGVEAARTIWRRLDIPSIFLTAHADEATLHRAREAEPLGYIVKPFHENELQAVIQMALHKSARDRAVRRRERDLAASFEALGEAVIRLDERGRVVFMNSAAERAAECSATEAEGRPLAEVLPLEGAHGESLQRFIEAAIHGHRIVELPPGAHVRSKRHGSGPLHGQLAPVVDGERKPLGAVLVLGSPEPGAPSPAASAAEAPPPAADGVIAEAEASRQLLAFSERIASSGVTTVLLGGESGVGKDLLAKFLHQHSRRRQAPFVSLNCVAIPETLLESELFGYEKGAFTDARSQKKGIFEMADGGTIFLDEIGEVQPSVQAKLLRVLEEQSFRRLGGVHDIQVDVRVIAATNRDLRHDVTTGRFRRDLYFRLNVIQIRIPPLRERREDVLPLAEHFIRVYNQRFERRVEGLSPEAAQALAEYDWPGNVRELRNAIERAMVLEESDQLRPESFSLAADDLDAPEVQMTPPPGSASLADVERQMLVEALAKANGNQTKAAQMLGVSRDTLRYRIKKYGLR